MKTLTDLFYAMILFYGIILFIDPFIYWLAHPAETHMQVFIRHWANYVAIILFITIYYVIENYAEYENH